MLKLKQIEGRKSFNKKNIILGINNANIKEILYEVNK